jgi:hypothetical protein
MRRVRDYDTQQVCDCQNPLKAAAQVYPEALIALFPDLWRILKNGV